MDIDDYDLRQSTVNLLKMLANGMDLLERGESSSDNSRAVALYLHSISDIEKGGVIIDLLTMVGYMESIILELKMRSIDLGD